MHAMIDLHNSSKYKVANTFNKEDTGRQLPTLEVRFSWRWSGGLEVFQSDIVKCSQPPACSVFIKF